MLTTSQKIQRTLIIALLIALSISLGLFTIKIPFGGYDSSRFSFGTPFIHFIAILFSPLYAGIAGGVEDILKFLIFPQSGAYLPQLLIVAIIRPVFISILFKNLLKATNNYIVSIAVAIFIPTVLFSIVNTFIFSLIFNWDKGIIFYLLPRTVVSILTAIYSISVSTLLYYIIITVFPQTIYIFGGKKN